MRPDGRHFSQTYGEESDPSRRDAREMWRKNRTRHANAIGVDINRNHSFLWDYRWHFSPYANQSSISSDNPSHGLFHGNAPNSEPETRSIHWLLDRLDKRSPLVWTTPFGTLAPPTGTSTFTVTATRCCMCGGDDDNQTTNPFMSFASSSWDGKRGTTCRSCRRSP
ncbi:M14 family zinc carboxypeptidase [Streptomyces sp. NPDC002730]|uniref:M14 family zinc carboxypeptidase n=1 Tax=Streptomyces sp. NPDC002730 TaxID=3364662 RepID=UPI0036777A56